MRRVPRSGMLPLGAGSYLSGHVPTRSQGMLDKRMWRASLLMVLIYHAARHCCCVAALLCLFKTGKATYTLRSGDKYEGEFLNGRFHGEGVYTFADPNKPPLHAVFANGKPTTPLA
jgi:hypothetical protein